MANLLLALAYSISDNTAENKNELRAGDEILKINGADCIKMCRSEATNYIKKLNGDYLTLVIRQ